MLFLAERQTRSSLWDNDRTDLVLSSFAHDKVDIRYSSSRNENFASVENVVPSVLFGCGFHATGVGT